MRLGLSILLLGALARAGDLAGNIFVIEVTTARSATARQTLAAPALCVGRDGLFLVAGFALDKPARRERDRVEVSILAPDGRRMAGEILGGNDGQNCTFFKLKEGERPPPPVPLAGASLRVGDKVVLLGRYGKLMNYAPLRREAVVEAVTLEPKVYYALRGVSVEHQGMLVATTDGRLVGFLDLRKTYPDKTGLMLGVGSKTVVVVPAGEYRGLEPRKRTKAWLGVNLAPFDRGREEYFSVKGDLRGALVTGISKGSPAAKAGIRLHDLLQVIGPYTFRYEQSTEWEAMLRHVQALPLQEPLKVRVVRFKPRGGRAGFDSETLELTMVMSERPTDFVDAAEVEVKDIGLTVRPATDDWRRRFNLREDAQGAVVTAIERASAAQLAGVRLNDLILAVDREAVKTPERLKELVAAARKAKRRRILLLVRRGNDTRFIGVEAHWR